jgi:hypothetical protein
MDFFKENRFLIQEIDGRKKYAIDKTVQINHMPFATNTTYRMMSAIPIGTTTCGNPIPNSAQSMGFMGIGKS